LPSQGINLITRILQIETKTVAIYARVSTDRQPTESQLNMLREFIGKQEWKLFREYIDTGFTGSNTKRPVFKEMMADARKRALKLST